jgi:hypothetical protein
LELYTIKQCFIITKCILYWWMTGLSEIKKG